MTLRLGCRQLDLLSGDSPFKRRSHVRTDHLIEKNGNADEAEYQWKETGDGSQEQHPH